MQPQVQQELTPDVVQQIVLNLKRTINQTKGEADAIIGEANNSAFQQILGMCNQLLNDKAKLQNLYNTAKEELKKIEEAHPEWVTAKTEETPKQ